MRWPLISWIAVLSTTVYAQSPEPIIDMHLHAYDTSSEWGAYGTPGPHGGKGPPDQRSHFEATYEQMRRHNIVRGVVSGSPRSVEQWSEWDEDRRLIRGLMLDSHDDFDMTPTRLEQMIESDRIAVFGEIGAYYGGTTLADPVWREYLAICEKHDIPVALHTGGGPPMQTLTSAPDARLTLGDPLLIEDVLVAFPKLRLYLMHAGEVYHEHALRMLMYYPNLYVDLGVLLWVDPAVKRYAREFLRNAKEAGALRQVMFGSDQMRWPDAIDLSLEYLDSLEFLTEQDKRDILYHNAARFLRLEASAP